MHYFSFYCFVDVGFCVFRRRCKEIFSPYERIKFRDICVSNAGVKSRKCVLEVACVTANGFLRVARTVAVKI